VVTCHNMLFLLSCLIDFIDTSISESDQDSIVEVINRSGIRGLEVNNFFL
jgi:hypothetical protein